MNVSKQEQQVAGVESSSAEDKRKRVVWVESEWHLVYDEVLRIRVQKAIAAGVKAIPLSIDAIEPDGIMSPIEVHKAAANVMTGDRARTIATVKGLYSPQMMQAFATWKEKMQLRVAHNAVPASMTQPAVMSASRVADQDDEPQQSPTSYTTTARAEAKHREREPREKHEWNDDQWQAVCNLLMKRMPLTMNSSTLVGVKLKDIESAARALWPDEAVPTFAMTFARSVLLECVVRAKSAPAVSVQPADSPVQALMKAFVEELVKGLAPTLADMEARMVSRMKGEVSNALRDAVAHIQPERRDATTRLPKVAVVGGYNKPHHLEQTLKEKFPQYRFVMLGRDPRNFVDTIKQCELVLCNIEGISHATQKAICKASREDAYRTTTGGETNLIRLLDVYTKTNQSDSAAH